MNRGALVILIMMIVFGANAQKERYVISPGNVVIGVGASKDTYTKDVNQVFERVAIFEFPVNLEVGVFKNLSVGGTFSPTLFNDVSAVDLEQNTSKRNHNAGNLFYSRANLNYYIFNEHRLAWRLTGGYGKGWLNLIQYKDDVLFNVKGQGMTYGIGTSLRYHLANEYEDVYPFYFELGMNLAKFKLTVDNSTIDGEIMDPSDSSWEPINFNSFDVSLTFGIRIGKPKVLDEQ